MSHTMNAAQPACYMQPDGQLACCQPTQHLHACLAAGCRLARLPARPCACPPRLACMRLRTVEGLSDRVRDSHLAVRARRYAPCIAAAAWLPPLPACSADLHQDLQHAGARESYQDARLSITCTCHAAKLVAWLLPAARQAGGRAGGQMGGQAGGQAGRQAGRQAGWQVLGGHAPARGQPMATKLTWRQASCAPSAPPCPAGPAPTAAWPPPPASRHRGRP